MEIPPKLTNLTTLQLKFSSAVLGLCAVALVGGGVVAMAARDADRELEKMAATIRSTGLPETTRTTTVRSKTPHQTVKGVYLTAYSANTPKKLAEIIQLIDTTELNAVVIDIKDYSGLVLFDTKNPLAKELDLIDNRYTDLAAIIQKLHDHNIYVIARQTVFQDPVLAKAKPELAIKSKRGGIWHDHKGLSWVDPTRQEVWGYSVAIAKEAVAYGFDEINFDYVRFPSDGNMDDVVYSVQDKKRYEIMESFYKYLGKQLSRQPVWVSIDMFGFVMEKSGEDDLHIGQRLVDAVDNVDYIYPMMYPSHYPPGHLNLVNPAANPAAVFDNGMKKGLPFFENKRAKVRPWIQAFNIGAVYDGAKIRAQIATIEKYTNDGWLMWNAANRYSSAGLLAE